MKSQPLLFPVSCLQPDLLEYKYSIMQHFLPVAQLFHSICSSSRCLMSSYIWKMTREPISGTIPGTVAYGNSVFKPLATISRQSSKKTWQRLQLSFLAAKFIHHTCCKSQSIPSSFGLAMMTGDKLDTPFVYFPPHTGHFSATKFNSTLFCTRNQHCLCNQCI